VISLPQTGHVSRRPEADPEPRQGQFYLNECGTAFVTGSDEAYDHFTPPAVMGQADSLRSVIEQMKTSPNANDRIRDEVPDVEDTVGAFEAEPAPAEVTISNAAEVPPAPAAPQAAE
jgi:hypothetical protein